MFGLQDDGTPIGQSIENKTLKDLFSNSSEIITNMESFNQKLKFTQLKKLYIINVHTIDVLLDDFFIGVSHPINKQLQKIMGQLGIVEQTGHGVPEIVKMYGREAFEITSNHITVILKFPFNISSNSYDYNGLSESHRKILKAIINHPSITINEICKVVDLKTRRVNEIIKDLKVNKIIEREGSNKSGYWKINRF